LYHKKTQEKHAGLTG